MHDFLSFLAPYYFVPFLLLFFLPGWSSLIIGGVCAYATTVWVFAQVDYDSPLVIEQLPIAGTIALGFIAGFVARLILLATRRLQHPLLHAFAIGPCVLVLAPLLLTACAHV